MIHLEKEIAELEKKANQLTQIVKVRNPKELSDYWDGYQDGERLMAQKAIAIIKQFQEEKAMAVIINTTGLYIIKPGVAPQLIRPNGVCNHCKEIFDENQQLKEKLEIAFEAFRKISKECEYVDTDDLEDCRDGCYHADKISNCALEQLTQNSEKQTKSSK